jgi:hypothetical protein
MQRASVWQVGTIPVQVTKPPDPPRKTSDPTTADAHHASKPYDIIHGVPYESFLAVDRDTVVIKQYFSSEDQAT